MADDQTGERGEFMALALRNLSPDEALRTKGKNGQDYFYIWREYIERIYELNSEEFIQEHHHAGWILLSEFILDAQ